MAKTTKIRLWSPLKVALEGQSCWSMGIQVIIELGFQGEGFWVKKTLSSAL